MGWVINTSDGELTETDRRAFYKPSTMSDYILVQIYIFIGQAYDPWMDVIWRGPMRIADR